VWLGGLYALPLAHNLDHRAADHTHGAPGDSHSHPHPHAEPHAHSHPHGHASTPSEEPEREPLDPDHGEGSLLHFAAVVVGSEPVVLPELSGTVVPTRAEVVPSVTAPALLALLARGPPRALSSLT